MIAAGSRQSLISKSGLQSCQVIYVETKIQGGLARPGHIDTYLHHHFCLRPHTGADMRRLMSAMVLLYLQIVPPVQNPIIGC